MRKIIAASIEYRDPRNSPSGETLYVATEAFTTASGDTPGNTFFAGRLQARVRYEWRVAAPFTGYKPVSSVGDLTIVNADGEYDDALNWRFRDGEVVIKMLDPSQNWSAGTVIATSVVDEVEFRKYDQILLRLRDPAAILDQPLQQSTFTDLALEPQAEGKLEPFAFGTPLNCEPVLVNEEDLRYHAHNATLVGMDKVRVNGAEVLFSATDKGFELLEAPNGRVTCDPIATGTSNLLGFTLDSPAPDGIIYSNNNKTIQNANRGYFSPLPDDQFTQVAGTSKASGSGGKYYFEIFVNRCQNNSANYNSTYGAFLGVAGGITQSGFSQGGWIDQSGMYSLGFEFDNVATYSNGSAANAWGDTDLTGSTADGAVVGVEVNFDVVPATMRFVLYDNNVGGAGRDLVWTSATLTVTAGTYQPFGTIVANTGATNLRSQDNKVTINTQPEQFLKPIPSGYEAWDVSAYDASTGFTELVNAIDGEIDGVTFDTSTRNEIDALGYSYSFYQNDTKSAAQVLFEACASFTGWYYVNRSGDVAFGRLANPVGTGVATFTDTEIISLQRIELDVAKGLSNRMGALKNWTPLNKDSIDDTVDEETQTLLSDAYRHQAVALSTPVEAYAHAEGNQQLGSYFRVESNADDEIERLISLYTEDRFFVTVDVAFELDVFTAIELGDVVKLVTPRYGFGGSEGSGAFSSGFSGGFELTSGGATFLVLGISGDYASGAMRLLLWGNANTSPAEAEETCAVCSASSTGLDEACLDDSSLFQPDFSALGSPPNSPNERRVYLEVNSDGTIRTYYKGQFDDNWDVDIERNIKLAQWNDGAVDGADYEVQVTSTELEGETTNSYISLSSDRTWYLRGFYDGTDTWQQNSENVSITVRLVSDPSGCSVSGTADLNTGGFA